jgi:hypothetical protein
MPITSSGKVTLTAGGRFLSTQVNPTSGSQETGPGTSPLDGQQQGSALTGNFDWKPLAKTVIPEPDCPDAGDYNPQWSFAVGAPGYSIASGESRTITSISTATAG